MFELQRSLNPNFVHLYDDAEKSLKAYPWLLDFCTYINLDRPLDDLEGYYVHQEVEWMRWLAQWEMADIDMPKELYDEIGKCSPDDLVPHSLKYKLFGLFVHFGGDGYPDMMNNFYKWYSEHYKVDMPLYKMRRGKLLLDFHRLSCAEYIGNVNRPPMTDEQGYTNKIVDAVDHIIGDDIPIPEETMCEALEYAEKNNLLIDIVPDEGHEQPEYNCPVHIEFKGKSGSAVGLSLT